MVVCIDIPTSHKPLTNIMPVSMLSIDDYQNFSYLVTYYGPLHDCWVTQNAERLKYTLYTVHILAAAECVSVVEGHVSGLFIKYSAVCAS